MAEEIASAERHVAINTLMYLSGTGWVMGDEPTEEEIQAFIRAMRENPRVVPSADPDDP
jgi:hypothetical protein